MSDKLTPLVQKMIQIESYSGSEIALAKFCEEKFKEWGFDEVIIDDYGSVIGIIRGAGEKTILLDGHLDTVEVSDRNKWLTDPFRGEIKEGKIYGRGASDMKGALGAMMLAASTFASSKKELKGNIVVTGTAWEEIYEGYTLGKIIDELTENRLKPDLVIIGEASDLRLKIGQRGRAEIVVKTFGKSAHAANPQVGINAVYKMQDFIKELRKIKPLQDEHLGKGIYVLTDILSNPYPGASVVPNQCRITIDRRLLVGETEESVLAPLQIILDKLKKGDRDFKGEVYIDKGDIIKLNRQKEKVKKFPLAWKLAEDHPLVKIGVEALKAVNLSGEITYYSFCTNGSYSAGQANIPTLGFGPSKENQAHVADEYIEISQLEKAFAGYRSLISKFLSS